MAVMSDLQREQEVRASQRLHRGICRAEVREMRRERSDPLPPLLKSVQKEDERARAQRIVEPAVGLLAYASLYLSLRCYESIIALHDKAAMSHRVDSRRALTSVQACFSRIFQPVSLKRNNLGVFGDGTSFPGTRGIRNVRDRMLQHA